MLFIDLRTNKYYGIWQTLLRKKATCAKNVCARTTERCAITSVGFGCLDLMDFDCVFQL